MATRPHGSIGSRKRAFSCESPDLDPIRGRLSLRLAPRRSTLLVVGAYVGAASLLGDDNESLAEVTVSLARADANGERWFGSVQGLDLGLDLDGRDVIIQL